MEPVSESDLKNQIETILREKEWQEGKVIPVAQSSARHRVVITCYEQGRNVGVFADGRHHNYGAYVELTRPNGSWIQEGMNIVPVLANGSILVIVEQRPAQGRYRERLTREFVCQGRTMDLDSYGPNASLETPGGALDLEGLTFSAGWMEELVDETGITEQWADVYTVTRPFFPQGSDVAVAMKQHVVYLTGMGYQKFVANDGGLSVLAMTPGEFQLNIWSGAICSLQAGVHAWDIYRQVEKARQDRMLLAQMMDSGYLTMDQVMIKRQPKR